MTNNTNNMITVEMTMSPGCFFRFPCDVCGGSTEKHSVLAQSSGTPRIVACETCLERGDIDATLVRHADALERRAAEVRGWEGRLKVPTFAEWQAAVDRENASFAADIAASKDKSFERTGESDETEVPF